MNKIIFSLFLLFPQLVFAQWVFTRSTVATKTLDSGPTSLSQVAINVPRVSDGVTVEGPSTNLASYSKRFDQWVLVESSVPSPNTYLAPDGTMTADPLVDSVNAAEHYARLNYTTSNIPYTFSVNAYCIDTDKQVLMYVYDGTHVQSARFDVCKGYVVATASATAKMEPKGNGWYRCSITSTPDAAASSYFIEPYRISGGGSGYAGAGTPVFALWQGQLEALSFATSEIETPSSGTVTRTADNLSIPLHQASTNKDLLPTVFGPLPNMANTLTVEFMGKCEWSTTVNMPTHLPMLSIGTLFKVEGYSDGKIYFMRDGSNYKASTAAITNYSNWHRYKFMVDYNDLSRSYGSIDGVNVTGSTGTWTGTTTFDTTGLSLYPGSDGTNASFCTTKDYRVNEIAF